MNITKSTLKRMSMNIIENFKNTKLVKNNQIRINFKKKLKKNLQNKKIQTQIINLRKWIPNQSQQ